MESVRTNEWHILPPCIPAPPATAALVRSGDKYLLIDMGKSCRTTLTALKSLGLAVSDCVGILVTHEHSDHVAGLDTFLKKYPVPLYGCADTLDTLALPRHAFHPRWRQSLWTVRRWKLAASR